jgi:glycosyltransferase involved in cell wall biosynthesis
MLVTVVTPTLNAIEYLDECLRSVARQTGPNVTVEHIVVDGGSSDGTAEFARSHGATVLEGTDSGLYDADNKGTAASSGELIGFLGADDLLLPGALETVVRVYERERRPWIVGGLRWVNGEGRSLGEIAAPPNWMSGSMMAALGWCCTGQQATYVTRQLFDDLGGFDISFKVYGDYDFYCKALAEAPWSRVTQTLACFRRHGANLSMGTVPRIYDEYHEILDRYGRTSQVARAVERQTLRGYLNVRNPTWAIRKKLGVSRSARPSTPAGSSAQ